MNQDSSNIGQIKVLAGIGFVCLEWALLEHLLLGVIATIETQSLERVYLMFGGLDMKPRCELAIRLLRQDGAPQFIVQQLVNIQKSLKDERLTDKRNQAVHGVHAGTTDPDSVSLTMVRWGPPKRTEIVSAIDLYKLGERLNALGKDVQRVTAEVHAWKVRVLENRLQDAKRQLGVSYPPIFRKLTKYLNSCAKRGARYFKR